MSLNISISKKNTPKLPRIVIFGVGGGGCNAVNNMIDSGVTGVEYVVANTDAQSLELSKAPYKIQLGALLTEGLGAGSNPEVGRDSALESEQEIREFLQGAHMCVVATGMGGGTGTGAAPEIARMAKELGILTIAIATKPFDYEGKPRAKMAEEGLKKLRDNVDSIIIVPNQNLIHIDKTRNSFKELLKRADSVLCEGVRSITSIIFEPGVINRDFADISKVLKNMGTAMLGFGEATATEHGDERSIFAAKEAAFNPLLENGSIKGAKRILLVITGDDNLGSDEVDVIGNYIKEQATVDENDEPAVNFGTTLKPDYGDKIRVTIIATGMDINNELLVPVAAPKVEPVVTVTTEATLQPELTQAVPQVIEPVNSLPQTVSTPSVEQSTIQLPQAKPTLTPNTDLNLKNEETMVQMSRITPQKPQVDSEVSKETTQQFFKAIPKTDLQDTAVQKSKGGLFSNLTSFFANPSEPKQKEKMVKKSTPNILSVNNKNPNTLDDESEIEIPSFLKKQNR